MDQLHQKLMEKDGVYAKWHNHPRQPFFHWLFLLAVIGLASTLLIYRVNNNSDLDSYGLQGFAQQGKEAIPEKLPELTTKLIQAIKKYQSAAPDYKETALNALIDAAQLRRQVMHQTVKSDPEKFLLFALPKGLADKIPAEALSLIEKEEQVQGVLRVVIIDHMNEETNGIDESKAETIFSLEGNNGKRYNLRFSGGEPEVKSGSIVKAKGVSLDGEMVMALSDSNSSSLEVVAATATGPIGDQRALVMLVNFTNVTSQPYTQAQVAERLFSDSLTSTNSYYKQVSFNQTNFSGDVTPWITIPYTNAGCDTMYRTWNAAADTAATQLGYNLGNYNRHVYVFTTSCAGWAGLSTVGGNPSHTWIFNYNDARLYEHELGHALGMWHASTIRCGTKAIDVLANCTGSEYGDTYDTMGSWNSYHVNGAHKEQLTFVPASRVQTVTSNGVYTIAPLETLTNEAQVLKIAKPNTSSNYYVDYRRPIGFDSTLPAGVTSGASIVIRPSGIFSGVSRSGNTARVDTTPADAVSNSALSDGASFVDEVNGITITQLSHTASSTVVQVAFSAGTCAKAAPTVSVSPVTQQGPSGQKLNYSMSVKNNNSSNCGNTTFTASVTGLPTNFTFTGSGITLAPGASGTASLSVTSPIGQVDGSYLFTAKASNTTDASNSGSKQATYVVYTDLNPPVVTINSPINGASVSGSVNISVSASDNTGISKVEFYIDGALKATDVSAPYSYKWNVNKQVAAGNHTIMVKAYGTDGSTGSASITVYK